MGRERERVSEQLSIVLGVDSIDFFLLLSQCVLFSLCLLSSSAFPFSVAYLALLLDAQE